jgi:hypothetical protein
MPPILFADNFLAGSLLTILLPLTLLIALAIWYVRVVRHVPEDTPASSASLPSADVLAAAEQTPPAATDDPPPGGTAPAG